MDNPIRAARAALLSGPGQTSNAYDAYDWELSFGPGDCTDVGDPAGDRAGVARGRDDTGAGLRPAGDPASEPAGRPRCRPDQPWTPSRIPMMAAADSSATPRTPTALPASRTTALISLPPGFSRPSCILTA